MHFEVELEKNSFIEDFIDDGVRERKYIKGVVGIVDFIVVKDIVLRDSGFLELSCSHVLK